MHSAMDWCNAGPSLKRAESKGKAIGLGDDTKRVFNEMKGATETWLKKCRRMRDQIEQSDSKSEFPMFDKFTAGIDPMLQHVQKSE